LNRKIKVAVIGAGKIATTAHIPAYLFNKDTDLVALVDIDRRKVERAARKFGVKKFFLSINELFDNEDVDAVSVCTPPNTHADIALKAFDYGAHVFCEKPLAINVKNGKRMVRASKIKERILLVGLNRRFWPNYQKAKKYISSGRLGHVYCAEDHYVQPNPLLSWGKSAWFHRSGVGGALLDLGPHVFDMLNYVFGDCPNAVSAHSSTYLDSPVEECLVCVLEYPENRIGVGVFSWLSSKKIEYLSIYGTASNLFASPKFFVEDNTTDIFEVSLWREASEVLIGMKSPHFPLLRTRNAHIFQLEINNFIELVKANQKFSFRALDALNVLIACNAAKESLEKNRRIEISSLTRI